MRAGMTTGGMTIALAAGVAACLAAAAPAAAQTPVTERLVVTSTVAPVPADQLTRTVTVLTHDDLVRLGAVNVTDALRLVPGVDARARGAFEVQTDFSIRGATFGQNLVLADGLRLNDSQSGHHNGEIPAPLASVDRIEVVRGASSSVHGADALGGTINVITRTDPYQAGRLSAGQFGFASAEGAVSGGLVPEHWTAALWIERAGNFRFPATDGGAATSVDREFARGGGSLRGAPAPGWIVDVRHQRRAFGANNFYGASPSKEWTDQTLTALSRQMTAGAWTWSATGLYRNHGDHFRWDINRPGFAENRHRTHAMDAKLTATRRLRTEQHLTLGVEAGGDWIRSSNLGRHEYGKLGVFAEIVAPLSGRATLMAGLRGDYYSTFGSTASPSVSAVVSLAPTVRLRGSVGHAFRIPSFTELYYTDPANLGSADLRAERGWSADGGVDWTPGGWTVSSAVFRRWDEDVIDWVRPTATDLWRSTNVRDVVSTGVEVSASRVWSAAAVRVSYAALDVDAPSLTLLSKYVLEYARHQTGVAITGPIAAGLRGAIALDHRSRLDGQEYVLGALRVSRRIRVGDVFVDVRNLFNARYREVAGVDLPGRWATVGLSLR